MFKNAFCCIFLHLLDAKTIDFMLDVQSSYFLHDILLKQILYMIQRMHFIQNVSSFSSQKTSGF